MLFHKLAAQQQGQAVAISHSQLLQVINPGVMPCVITILNLKIKTLSGVDFPLVNPFGPNFVEHDSDNSGLPTYVMCHEF